MKNIMIIAVNVLAGFVTIIAGMAVLATLQAGFFGMALVAFVIFVCSIVGLIIN